MSITQNRAFEWVSQDLKPYVLSVMILVALARFIYALWPKWAVFSKVPSEDRLNHPIRRLGKTILIAILQAKMFKDTKTGWMHALIFWGFLIFLFRASWFFFIGILPTVELSGGTLESVYAFLKDIFIVLVTLATCYALYRRTVVKPERLTQSLESIVILALILAIMISDILFDAGWQTRNLPTPLDGVWLGSLVAPMLSLFDSNTVIHLHNLSYWTHLVCILYFLTIP